MACDGQAGLNLGLGLGIFLIIINYYYFFQEGVTNRSREPGPVVSTEGTPGETARGPWARGCTRGEG